ARGSGGLLIFRADQAYISPNWYPSKPELHRQVPTWNCRVVHVHGRLRIRDDERFVRGVVGRLTRTHEAQAEPEKPWKMSDSSRDYIDQMLAAIVGIEIEITRLTGRSEEHTSELQSRENIVCRLLLEKKKKKDNNQTPPSTTTRRRTMTRPTMCPFTGCTTSAGELAQKA